jgi:hypothetical protein
MVDVRSGLGLREVLDNGQLVSYLVVSPAALDELVAQYAELSEQQTAAVGMVRRLLVQARDLANRGFVTREGYEQLVATAQELATAAQLNLDLTELRKPLRPVFPGGKPGRVVSGSKRTGPPVPVEELRARAEAARRNMLLEPCAPTDPAPEELAARIVEVGQSPVTAPPAVQTIVAQLADAVGALAPGARAAAVDYAVVELHKRLAG